MKLLCLYGNNKILIFCVILSLLWSGTGCLRRVAAPPTSPELEKSRGDLIYVHLKDEVDSENNILTVKQPGIEGEYLIGRHDEEQIRIPLDDIKSVEVPKIDRKKVAIGSAILVVLTLIAYLHTTPLRLLAED